MFLKRLIWAALLSSDTPLNLNDFLLLTPDLTKERVLELLNEIQKDCLKKESVLDLIETEEGFFLRTQADLAQALQNLHCPNAVKLSRASLEILAVIAYRQPASRGDIEAIRGVAVNPNSLQLLLSQGWIKSLGTRNAPGKPEIFGTTEKFLTDLNLKKLEDLPPLP